MQTFFELEQKLLNQHEVEYRAFTRLLLTISIACITLLASSGVNGNFMYLSSLVLLFLSVLFGMMVQHRIMMNPIYHLELAKNLLDEAEKAQNQEGIELRRKPTKIEQYMYRLQAITFVLSFLFLSVYLIQKSI